MSGTPLRWPDTRTCRWRRARMSASGSTASNRMACSQRRGTGVSRYPRRPGPVEAALDLLEGSIEQGTTVVAIGPVTNLSLLERRSPGILRRANVVVMGGYVLPPPAGFPHWDHEMDFNLQSDAEAARHVLDAADAKRLTLVPIEVTVQTSLGARTWPRYAHQGRSGASWCGRPRRVRRTNARTITSAGCTPAYRTTWSTSSTTRWPSRWPSAGTARRWRRTRWR
ncbi:MAG: hypothetical protein GEU80_11135 [Dehalococcoidia bacterium]|nr:hypothetical protein [Dehalococcoidia bacterium]